jgi:hypothetical protein
MSFDVYFMRDDYSSIVEAKRQDLLRLLAAAKATAAELEDELALDAKFRLQASEASKQLTRTLQKPVDRAMDLLFQPVLPAALQVALDAGWVAHINGSADGHEASVTASQIAKDTSSDVELVKRLMRVLTANGTIRETRSNEYAPTSFSKLFDNPGWANGLRHSLRDFNITLAGMPAFLAKHQYNLENTQETLYKRVHGANFFELVFAGGDMGAQFNSFMSVTRDGKKPWFDVYPVAERLDVSSPADAVLVDVGGGKGHDLIAFSQFMAKLQMQGTLVLQDQPSAIESVPTEHASSIEIQAHDFFTPQKVIGARAYFLKHILHDWSDEDCVAILTRIRDAMKSGYSKILINEIVLPDEKCDSMSAGRDVVMMALLDAKERSREQWGALIEMTGGLAIDSVWPLGFGDGSIIEVTKKDV